MTSHLPVKRQSQVRFTVHGNNIVPGDTSSNSMLPTPTSPSSASREPPLISQRIKDPQANLAKAEMLQQQSQQQQLHQNHQDPSSFMMQNQTISGISPVAGKGNNNADETFFEQQQQQQIEQPPSRSSLASSVNETSLNPLPQHHAPSHRPSTISSSKQHQKKNSATFSGKESPIATMMSSSSNLFERVASASGNEPFLAADGESQRSQQDLSPNSTQAKQINYLQQQLQILSQERDLFRNECFTIQQRHRDLTICFDNQTHELNHTKQQLAALKQKITEAVSAESMRIAQEQVWNDRLRASAKNGHNTNHEADEMEIKLRALKEETASLQRSNQASMRLPASQNPYTSMKQKYELEIQQLKEQISRDTKITEAMRKDMEDVVSIFYAGVSEMEAAVTSAADGARLPPPFSENFLALLNDNTRMGLAKAALQPGFFKAQLDRINRQRLLEKQAAKGSATQGKPIADFDPDILRQQQEAALFTHSRFNPDHPPPLGCSHTIEAFTDEIRAAVNRCFIKVSANVMRVGQDAAAIREILGKNAALIVDEIRFGLIPQNLFTKDFVKQIQDMADRALREVEFVTETQYGTTIPKMLGDVGVDVASSDDDDDGNRNISTMNDIPAVSKSGVVTTPSRAKKDSSRRTKTHSPDTKQNRKRSSSSSSKKNQQKRSSSSNNKRDSKNRKNKNGKERDGRKKKQNQQTTAAETPNNISNISATSTNPPRTPFTTTNTTSSMAANAIVNRNINNTAAALSSPQSLFDPDASIVSQMSSDLNVIFPASANNSNQQHQIPPYHHSHQQSSTPPIAPASATTSNTGSPRSTLVRRGDGMTMTYPSQQQQNQQQNQNQNQQQQQQQQAPSSFSRRTSSARADSSELSREDESLNTDSDGDSTNSTSSSTDDRCSSTDDSSDQSSSYSSSSSNSSSSSGRKHHRGDKKSKKNQKKRHRRHRQKISSSIEDSFTEDERKRNLASIIDHLKSRPMNMMMGSPESLIHVSGALTNMTLLLHNNLKVHEDNKGLIDRMLNEFYFSVKNMIHVPKKMTSEANSVAGDDDDK